MFRISGSKTLRLALAGMSSLAFATAASAQPESADASSPNDVSDQSEVAPGAEATADDMSGEIIVTARRRAETLQDVPMAVTGIAGDQLERENITETPALFARVPNLYFTTAGGASPSADFNYLVIRGVGYNGGLEPATGVFIDGMYQPQLGFDIAFLDLERVEVLRGPQGTLFGRNTQAGAVSIITRQPGRDMQGRFELELAEFGSARLRASASGPVTDTLSAGFAFQAAHTGGYINNRDGSDYNFATRIVGRANVRWQPTDTVELLASVDYNHDDFNDQAFGVPLAPRRYVAQVDQDEDDSKSGYGGQVTLNVDLTDDIKLTSQTGLRSVTSDILIDDDANITDQTPLTLSAVPFSTTLPPVPLFVALLPITVAGTAQRVDLTQDFWSQEVRLTGSSSNFDWLAGGYYFEQKIDQFRSRDVGPGVPFVPLYIRESFFEKRDGYAAFGQVSYRPLPPLELTVGGRYSKENVRTGGDRVLNVADASINAFQKDGEADFSNFSPMASISYDINDDILVYATYSAGWKAGGINRFPSRPNAILPYDAETSQNYELGLKTKLFDNRVRANFAVFNIDIEDQQLLNVVPDPNGSTPVTTIANAAKSRSRGFEADIEARLLDNLRIRGSYGYVDAKFREFIQVGTGVTKDRSGEPFEFTPRHNASASATYTANLSPSAGLEFLVNYRYISGYRVSDVNLTAPLGAQLRVPGYDRLDARVTLALDSGFRLSAFVNNIFDSFDYTNISRGQYDQQSNPARYVVVLPPRQFGLSAAYSF
ncbi:TonB-dependent receptor [Sphingosinicella rhizophila]|uniref:TonB-dependent receptor n=1 Tax=Sphingosinicella rhizophila TaxID=3050082 RepID=A0ABU3Q9N6_9SPHN|nr:TonB-dependent receptor [Sphingosinicella sp. GR2756]MDT9600113.1 TonB-dependent receptor [Sphingosinicella sp. GR2756]